MISGSHILLVNIRIWQRVHVFCALILKLFAYECSFWVRVICSIYARPAFFPFPVWFQINREREYIFAKFLTKKCVYMSITVYCNMEIRENRSAIVANITVKCQSLQPIACILSVAYQNILNNSIAATFYRHTFEKVSFN